MLLFTTNNIYCMKKIIVMLLTAVLCMAGCKDPGSVSFSVKEMEVKAETTSLSVNIEADCTWTLECTEGKASADVTDGTGPASVVVRIPRNEKYDDVRHALTVSGGDTSDRLVINQKGKYDIIAQQEGIISCEGGSFHVTLSTNDEILSVDTPEWISFTSSRALASYTYTFNAGQNKTGSVRKATVVVNVKEKTGTIDILHDSSPPSPTKLQHDLSVVTSPQFETRILVEPEYADMGKVSVSSSGRCSASIKDGYLHFDLKSYGTYEFSLSSNDDVMLDGSFEYLPKNPFGYSESAETYKGKKNFVAWEHFSRKYQLSSSNAAVVRVSDNDFEAVGIGTATVSVKVPGTDIRSSMAVKVEPFVMISQLENTTEKYDGSFDVKFAARVTGPSNMVFDGFTVLDKKGRVIVAGKGTVRKDNIFYGQADYSISTAPVNIRYDRTAYGNLENALDGYTFMASVNIGGKNYNRHIKVNVYRTGPL